MGQRGGGRLRRGRRRGSHPLMHTLYNTTRAPTPRHRSGILPWRSLGGRRGCLFYFQRTRLLSRCRGSPTSSRPTLTRRRRGFLPLIEWPILCWGLPPEICAKLLPGMRQHFSFTRLPPALPEGGRLAATEVSTLLPLGPYSYRGSPRHRVPKRFLVCGYISCSRGWSPPSRKGARSWVQRLPHLPRCTSRPSSLPFLLPLRHLLPCASARVYKGLRPGHVLCVSHPVTGPPGGAERRQAKKHKGGEQGVLPVVPAGRGAPGVICHINTRIRR